MLGLFPGRENVNLLSDSNIMNLLLKINVGRGKSPNVVILEWFDCRWEGGEVGRWKGG